jgi:hypothetical protein
MGGKELAPLLLFLNLFFVSGASDTFAADPPDRLNFRRG